MKRLPKFCKSVECPKHRWNFYLRIRSINNNYVESYCLHECVASKKAKFLFTNVFDCKECLYVTYFGNLKSFDKEFTPMKQPINSGKLLKILCAWKKYIEKRSDICLTKT